MFEFIESRQKQRQGVNVRQHLHDLCEEIARRMEAKGFSLLGAVQKLPRAASGDQRDAKRALQHELFAVMREFRDELSGSQLEVEKALLGNMMQDRDVERFFRLYLKMSEAAPAAAAN